jgi:hypothetical protein
LNYDNWYLVRVWKQSKLLFLILILFIVFQILFSAKRIQNFPFFTYDMYSRPIEKPDVFTLYIVKSNQKVFDYTQLTNTAENKLLSTVQSYESNILSYPDFVHETVLNKRFYNKNRLTTYEFIKEGLSNDAGINTTFPKWLKHCYFSQNDSFSIEKNTYQFSDKSMTTSKTMINFNAN